MLSDTQLQRKLEILSNKLRLGNYDEVISDALTLLKKNKHQVLFNILSLAYQSKGELKNSEKIMDDALKLNPNNPYFLNNMGITQHKMINFLKAEEFFMKGLKIAPDYINILNNLGNLKRDLDQSDEAIKYYKKSLSINPNVIETLFNISICYQSLGNFKQAKINLKNLLKINPKFTSADRLISSMTNYKDDSDHLNEMKNKQAKFELNEIELANLFFGLGKAYEDLNEYKISFDNYKKGNDLLKKNSSFKIDDEKKKFEYIKRFFSNNLKENELKNSRKLIFIIGMPRSGTSLIEQILSSHKDVYGGGELIFLKKIIEKNFLNNKIDNKITKIENVFQNCYKDYIDKISFINKTKKTFTDKSPLNFQYVGFIKKIFPNSKIINCRRDKLDVCWSNFKNYFGESLPFTNSFYDLVNYYKIYEEFIRFWENKFPNEIYHMNYSKLIENPENEIKKLIGHCGLDWDPNCLKHEQNKKTIKTASAAQARKSINKDGLKTFKPFKDYLTELLRMIEAN